MFSVKDVPSEFDQPWKLGIEWKLEDALHLGFAQVHSAIDWTIPYQSLDTELAKLAPEHQQGALTVDKPFKVQLKSGEPRWLYVHIEIQAQKDGRFEIRMWTYNYRLCDRFGPELISLAILADDDPQWRPGIYHHEFAGCVQHFEFPVFKVLDCLDPESVFERTHNRFALLVAAHQAALRTRGDPAARSRERLRLVKYLYRHGLLREEVKTLFRLIGWLTKLPQDLELKFRDELLQYEQAENIMTLDTLLSPTELAVLEQYRQEGWQKGQQEGSLRTLRQAVTEALEARFGAVPDTAKSKIHNLRGEEELRRAHRMAVTTTSVEKFLQDL